MEKSPKFLIKNRLDKIIGNCLKKKVFSACSVGFFNVDTDNKQKEYFSYGYTEQGKLDNRVEDTTYFDLASLTKPLVTSFLTMILFEQGKIALDDSLAKFFSEGGQGKEKITIYHLLTHSSGLPAHKNYYKKIVELEPTIQKEVIIDWILAENLLFEPGTDTLYSDLGFIVLGKIIEKISGYPLDSFYQREITKPLGLEKDLFFTNNKKRDPKVYAGTGRCEWTNTELYGKVNDANCRSLGGVAGHAGLFGTITGVLSLCENIMEQFYGGRHNRFISSESLNIFFKKQKNSNWALGFDMPSLEKPSSGKYFSPRSVGHLGFTGTSFWMDLEKGIVVVLLTNRVLCGEDLSQIRKLRPIVHDVIMEHLVL